MTDFQNITTQISDHLKILPLDFTPPLNEFKPTESEKPNIKGLIGSQREVYDMGTHYLAGDTEEEEMRMFGITGYAGTGKTHVVTQMLKWYVSKVRRTIAITAPTNKAVKVLRVTANFQHPLVKYSTIHKLLGLKEARDDRTGKLEFKKDWDSSSDIDTVSALVVDEKSMLQDELFMMLQEQQAYSSLKMMFVGDPIQIPPVGKSDSIPCTTAGCKAYSIYTMHLNEIIRQKAGHPIIELADVVRKHYRDANIPYKRVAVTTPEGSISIIRAADKSALYQICQTYFTNPRFEYDADFMKVIAYTNKTVNFMNDKIRSFIYRDKLAELQHINPVAKLPRILLGEKLIASSPILEALGYKTVKLFDTSDEFEVVEYNIEDKQLFENVYIKIYRTKVLYMDYSDMKKMHQTIDIIHEDSLSQYNSIMDAMKANIFSRPVSERGQMWKMYFKANEKFADINYNYAITAHKSQGSTYDNTVVIAADIFNSYKVEERNRIFYVAITRARHNLFLVE